MKNEMLWTKTVLSVYRYLERISGAIDKIVLQSALSSSNILGQNYHYNNVYSISQKLIDLSERKVTLINLKILTETILSEMSVKEAAILIQRYFDGKKMKDIAQDNDISMRSVFRKLTNAESVFDRKLKIKGYDEQKLQEFLKDEQWILNAYRRIANENVDDFSLSNNFLARAVSM